MDQHKLYCADHHFFHESMLKWFPESRPFANISQMHEYMIEAHNARASNSTDVYILGDLAYGRKVDPAQIRKVFEKLKGRKHLIMGNHDDKDTLNLRWSSQPSFSKTINDNGRRIFLCHYAVHSWPGFYNGDYHFFGHTHGKLPTHGRMMDVGVDAWGLSPVTATEVIERMKTWNADFDSYKPERKSVITCAEENVPEEEYVLELRNDPGYGGYGR
ncbi:metallophosphoesterase [Rhizobium laguerreae]|uniref:metallophosphoesterase n=1 Tax=Rhizobium laguerreae TaxID=1076926 RepID=UPI001C9248D8|nr:metallophosphoesterase [Rhizobium laguerreae]